MSPFHLDPRPLDEMSSPHAGLLATSRAFRSLRLPETIAAKLSLKQRARGFTGAQFVETLLLLLLLLTAGGDCPEDLGLLKDDPCLHPGPGYAFPKVSAMRAFLGRFHGQELNALRPGRDQQKGFILPSSHGGRAWQEVHAGLVGRVANTLWLRLCASVEAIARLRRIREVFALPTLTRANT